MLSADQVDVLRYYRENVIKYVTLATVVSRDRFPQEILTEIRASYTHLAKSTTLDPATLEYRNELDRAKGHLLRVCFDCLKLAIMFTAEEIEKQIEAIEKGVALPNDIYTKARSLKERREEFMIYEAQTPPDSRIDSYNFCLRITKI
jgi:hypothetical protein